MGKDERAKAAAHAEKSLTKKNKKDKRGQKNACESDVDDADDVDGWTQVKSTDKKQISEKGSDKVARKENVHTAQAQITWENNGGKPSHMKTIADNTGAKFRIRGRGSGYLEGPAQTEASDEPLMLCISAESREGFEAAVQDVESLLGHVH